MFCGSLRSVGSCSCMRSTTGDLGTGTVEVAIIMIVVWKLLETLLIIRTKFHGGEKFSRNSLIVLKIFLLLEHQK